VYRASTQVKGQLPVLLGLVCAGAFPHLRLNAGGNDLAQLKTVVTGVVTTGANTPQRLASSSPITSARDRSDSRLADTKGPQSPMQHPSEALEELPDYGVCEGH